MFVLLLLILVIMCVCLLKTNTKRPPFAQGAWPIVGHTSQVIRRPEGIADPDDVNLVLNSCLQKDIIYDYLKPCLGEGLISASEVVWQRHRKLLNPTFNQVVLDSYMPEFNKHSRTLIQNLEANVGKGMFNHAPAIEDMALQAICCKLVLSLLAFQIIKKRKAEMDLKRAETEHRFKPFLELLLDMAKDGAFTDVEVQEEVDTFTAAGSDTVSVSLTIALLAIASNPEVQRKVVEELQEVFKGSERDVEKQDLVQLKYLEAVIKETMRLYPAVPLVARTLDKNVKIKNFILPAGGRCFVSIYGVNRHPVWGPDAEAYRPERWLDAASLPSQHAFASFGLGRRKCIGNNYAIIFMKTTLAHVLRRYKVSGDITQLEQTMEVVGRPVAKDYISIERRTKMEYIG